MTLHVENRIPQYFLNLESTSRAIKSSTAIWPSHIKAFELKLVEATLYPWTVKLPYECPYLFAQPLWFRPLCLPPVQSTKNQESSTVRRFLLTVEIPSTFVPQVRRKLIRSFNKANSHYDAHTLAFVGAASSPNFREAFIAKGNFLFTGNFHLIVLVNFRNGSVLPLSYAISQFSKQFFLVNSIGINK